MSLGLCVSPRIRITQDDLTALRPPFVRSILYSVVDDLTWLLSLNVPLLITLNNEADMVRADWTGWETALEYVAARAGKRILALSCGNELDLFWAQNPADVPPAFGADLVKRADPILRPAGIPIATTSLAGPRWPEYLDQMLRQGANPDLVDLHPYGRRPDGWGQDGWFFGTLGDAIRQAEQIADRPVICSEYGVKVSDASGEDQQAAFLSAVPAALASSGVMAAWFAYHDAMGAFHERGADGFGLVRVDGTRRPAWHAFAAVNKALAEPPAPPPAPTPEPEPAMPTRDELVAYARAAARRNDLDEHTFEKQIQQESSFNPRAYNQGSGASGISQLVPRFHPGVDPWDPYASLDYAARWMAELVRQFGSYRKALAAYNWGPGRVATWDGSREALPDETRRYLDVILGPGWPEPTAPETVPDGVTITEDLRLFLAGVVERARREIGKPYSGPIVGQPDAARRGDPGWDCSSFVEGMLEAELRADLYSWAYTDTMANESVWVRDPVPGTPVFYHYPDPSQPNTYWPHVGLWLSPTEVLDCRYPEGVGIHAHVTPVSDGVRFRRTMLPKRLSAISLPAPETPPPSQVDPIQALRDERDALLTAVAHLADVTVPNAAAAAAARDEALAEAQRIREQFVGPPAA